MVLSVLGSVLASRSVYRTSLSSLQQAAGTGRTAHVKKALEEVGGFAVEGLGEDYADALTSLQSTAPHCLDGAKRVRLDDGVERFTFVETHAEDLPDCLQAEAEIIQAVFDRVEREVVTVLAQVLGNSSLLVKEAGEVKDLSSLPSKTHLHVYRPSPSLSNSIAQPHSLPFHQDNGLYLLLTPSPSAPLVLRSMTGKMVSTSTVPASSVLFLLGRGLTRWLLQDTPHGLVAAPHAVPSVTSARTVEARMKVADDEAVPANRGPLTANRGPLTFKQVFTDGTVNPSAASLCHYGGPLTEDEWLSRTKRSACWPHTGENCEGDWDCKFTDAKNPCARDRYSFTNEGGNCQDDRDCDSFTCCNTTEDESQGEKFICNSLKKFCKPHGRK